MILPDNDAPGLAMAQTAAKALQGEAASVKILRLSKKWPSLPEKGDISDVFAMEPTEDVFMKLEELESETPEWEPSQALETAEQGRKVKAASEFGEDNTKFLVIQ